MTIAQRARRRAMLTTSIAIAILATVAMVVPVMVGGNEEQSISNTRGEK